jgi:predicted amidohydrolase YtcJ
MAATKTPSVWKQGKTRMIFKANLGILESMRTMPKRFCHKFLWFAAISLIHPLVVLHANLPSEFHDADLILRGGKIITMDGTRSVVTSLAVSKGKILAAGSDSEIAACSGPRTQIINLHGQTVLPGLIDVHTHALNWAEGLLRDDVDPGYPKVHSISEIVKQVSERSASYPAAKWIIGAGWDESKLAEHRYITRKDLDAVSPNNPVWLEHFTGHLGVANSLALKLAHVSRDTATPSGGIVDKDDSGEPTGILKDNAQALVQSVLPPDPPDLALRATHLVSEKALETGLTTIHDICLPAAGIRAYQGAHKNGWLKVRVQMAPLVSNIEDAGTLANGGVYTGFGDDFLKFGAVKMFADGGMAAKTIAVYEPAEGESGNLGLLIWKPEDMQKAHHLLAGAGWQLETHAIGDRAMDEVLDSYQAVMKDLGLKEPRFRIVHAGFSTPPIQKRIRELHVLVDANPAFVYWIGAYFSKYGPQRIRWTYPAKSYFDNGIVAAGTSDVGVTPISPWWGIWAAVERRELHTSQVWAPEERVTVLQALEMYTRNPAYIGFEESQKGSLEPGKLADFIIVDRDVLTVPSEQLKEVQVLKTFVGGELVYAKPVTR